MRLPRYWTAHSTLGSEDQLGSLHLQPIRTDRCLTSRYRYGPRGMSLYASQHALCLTACSMPHSVLYASQRDLCLTAYSMPHSVLFASQRVYAIPLRWTMKIENTTLPHQLHALHCYERPVAAIQGKLTLGACTAESQLHIVAIANGTDQAYPQPFRTSHLKLYPNPNPSPTRPTRLFLAFLRCHTTEQTCLNPNPNQVISGVHFDHSNLTSDAARSSAAVVGGGASLEFPNPNPSATDRCNPNHMQHSRESVSLTLP